MPSFESSRSEVAASARHNRTAHTEREPVRPCTKVLSLMMDAIFNIAAERFSAVHDARAFLPAVRCWHIRSMQQDGAQVILDCSGCFRLERSGWGWEPLENAAFTAHTNSRRMSFGKKYKFANRLAFAFGYGQ
jgi:hypothetical protein